MTTPVPLDATAVLEFWRELVRGKIQVVTAEGSRRTIEVPLAERLRASENLAKFLLTPAKAAQSEEAADPVTATPDILRLAELLEKKITDVDLEALFRGRVELSEDTGDDHGEG